MMRGLMMELKAENISFSYHKKKPILKDVSLSLNSNQIIGLIGDSGSGKSTLCKIISGYISNYAGEVTIDGNSVNRNGYDPIQLIFQHPEKTIPPQNLKDTFGLKDNWLTRWPSELSGGELQRFSILRALNPQTKFIIADEISTMLDAVTQVQIWEALIKHCKANNIGILAVSHDKDLLDVICDDILYFNEINHL